MTLNIKTFSSWTHWGGGGGGLTAPPKTPSCDCYRLCEYDVANIYRRPKNFLYYSLLSFHSSIITSQEVIKEVNLLTKNITSILSIRGASSRLHTSTCSSVDLGELFRVCPNQLLNAKFFLYKKKNLKYIFLFTEINLFIIIFINNTIISPSIVPHYHLPPSIIFFSKHKHVKIYPNVT